MRAVTSTNNDGAIGWLKALQDPQIGQALAVIHSWPHEPWTVAALAAQVGLSRTAFTLKFKQLVGESPLRYLTRWRLNKAAIHDYYAAVWEYGDPAVKEYGRLDRC